MRITYDTQACTFDFKDFVAFFFLFLFLVVYDITSADFANSERKLLLYHRYLEANKFAFGLRYHLGDDPNSLISQQVGQWVHSKTPILSVTY